MEVAL
ncbi:044fc74c-91b0-4364-9291-ec3543562db5 [Thermothielavioides terrestris]